MQCPSYLQHKHHYHSIQRTLHYGKLCVEYLAHVCYMLLILLCKYSKRTSRNHTCTLLQLCVLAGHHVLLVFAIHMLLTVYYTYVTCVCYSMLFIVCVCYVANVCYMLLTVHHVLLTFAIRMLPTAHYMLLTFALHMLFTPHCVLLMLARCSSCLLCCLVKAHKAT